MKCNSGNLKKMKNFLKMFCISPVWFWFLCSVVLFLFNYCVTVFYLRKNVRNVIDAHYTSVTVSLKA